MKISRHQKLACFVLLALVCPLGIGAAEAGMSLSPATSIAKGANAVIGLTLTGNVTGTPRLYFRRQGHGDFYFVIMQSAGATGYFGILPKPAPETDRIEYYVALLDGSGKEVERTATSVVPVSGTAIAPSLTPGQASLAGSLVVGDSVASQRGHGVAWFSPEGVNGRLDVSGNAQPMGSTAGGTDNLPNTISVGDPGPSPKEISLPRP